ncbi:MAG: hypothetical protein U1E91_02095 [Moraxella sp.]
MVLKTGRFGAYFTRRCDNTRKVLKNYDAAPPRMTAILCQNSSRKI